MGLVVEVTQLYLLPNVCRLIGEPNIVGHSFLSFSAGSLRGERGSDEEALSVGIAISNVLLESAFGKVAKLALYIV